MNHAVQSHPYMNFDFFLLWIGGELHDLSTWTVYTIM